MIHSEEVKTINKIKLQQDMLPRDAFIECFEDEFELLREHIRRTTAQYTQTRNIRENLNIDTEMTIQMDYSENYACIFQDEPSAAYFDRNMLTIHPMVAHFRDSTDT